MIGRFKGRTATWIYGYLFVKVGIHTFYKKHQAHNIETVPYSKKPIIFASNHQNAFLDPILITIVGKKNTYYLTRADIFQKPFLNKLFRGIYMLPIYRPRDGGDPKVRNQETFNECYDLLNNNEAIIIFPEGNHAGQHHLRQLKKGLVRIGYGAMDKYGEDLDVHIIPVGLNYSRFDGFQSEFLINFGKPIRLQEYLEDRKKDETRTINKITARIREGMSNEMIDIQDLEHYTAIDEMLYIYPKEIDKLAGRDSYTLYDKFIAQKGFIEKVENDFKESPETANSISSKVKSILDYTKKKKLKYWLFEQDKYSLLGIMFSILLLIIGLPFHIYGVINNYIPYKIPVWFVQKKIKDKTFHGSFKMAFGVLFFQIFWLLQIGIVALFTDDYIWLLYAISLPISAMYSWNYWKFYLKTLGKIRYNKALKTNEFKKVKQEREEVAQYILNLKNHAV